MKVLLSLIFLFSSLLLGAQSSSKSFDRQLQTTVELYEMDAAQASQYKQIATEKQAALSRLEKSNADYQEKLTEIQNNFDQSVLSILDERQKKIFAIQKAMRNSNNLPDGRGGSK